MKVAIRKAFGDYENTANGKIRSGYFWEAKYDDLIIRRPGSMSKSKFKKIIQDNLGRVDFVENQ